MNVTLDSSGRYGFRIDRDHEKTYFFSSDDKNAIRDWTKAIMKATISWQHSSMFSKPVIYLIIDFCAYQHYFIEPVVSSCNISTIPMSVARAMDPVPRPPSPSARETIQRSLRRRNTNDPSSRDTRVLLGLSSNKGDDQALSDSFAEQWQECIWLQKQTSPQKSVLHRPSLPELGRVSSTRSTVSAFAHSFALRSETFPYTGQSSRTECVGTVGQLSPPPVPPSPRPQRLPLQRPCPPAPRRVHQAPPKFPPSPRQCLPNSPQRR